MENQVELHDHEVIFEWWMNGNHKGYRKVSRRFFDSLVAYAEKHKDRQDIIIQKVREVDD